MVVTQTPNIPAPRARITISPTHNPGDDVRGGSFSFSPGLVGLGWAVLVGEFPESVSVRVLKAVNVARGVVVGGGGCVAPIWTSKICPS